MQGEVTSSGTQPTLSHLLIPQDVTYVGGEYSFSFERKEADAQQPPSKGNLCVLLLFSNSLGPYSLCSPVPCY